MNKTEFIKVVADKAWVSQTVASEVFETCIDTITSELKSRNEVNITWFGSFKVSERKERNWVNPRTREKLIIPASVTPAFKAWKTLKENIKN